MEGYKYEDTEKGRGIKPVIAENMDVGLTMRAIREIFAQTEGDKSKTVTVSCSFLQIYNEKVFDLLNSQQLKGKSKMNQAGLKIRWSKTEQFTVENLFVFRCNDADHCIEMYNKGIKNKIVASHNLNHASSRSHAIFTVKLETVSNDAVDNVTTSKFQLVDLAGSERSA